MHKVLLSLSLVLCLATSSYAAPCYGTKMPKKEQFFIGTETHYIFKRYLENDFGTLRSKQYFFLVSYGVYSWLSLDLKVGTGNIRQHPSGGDEVHYASNFAGGYGFRLKLYDQQNLKMVFGFQHISVHPKSIHLADVRNKAILDDWQFSFLISHDFLGITPYLGTRWSRVDYIHWVESSRKRRMSDLTKDIGLIFGFDIPLTEKIWLNLEGQFFDSEALAISMNYSF